MIALEYQKVMDLSSFSILDLENDEKISVNFLLRFISITRWRKVN